MKEVEDLETLDLLAVVFAPIYQGNEEEEALWTASSRSLFS